MRILAALTAVLLLASAPAAQPPPPAAEPRLPSDDLFQNPRRSFHRFDDFVYTPRERLLEAGEKLLRLRRALAARKLDGVVIGTEYNLNWLSAGGKSHVVWAQRESPVKLLVTADKVHLVADNIEGPRMMTEEFADFPVEWARYNWYGKESDALGPLLKGKKVAFDLPAVAAEYGGTAPSLDWTALYYPVTAGELKKYRWLGRKTVEVLEQVAEAVRPGMSERDVQYLLCRELWYWDIFPTVVLSAADERFQTYRHPVVHGATLRRYVALNVCTRRWGLVISTTRLVHFGEPEGGLARAWKDGPQVMAAMWAASRPGKTLGDAVKAAQSAYSAIGFPNEWQLHHQGGLILTRERLALVKPGDDTRIIPGMVLAWNPTVQGAKFEDTVLVKPDGTLENLTPCLKWPTVAVEKDGQTYQVPGLLIRPVPPPP
jgi:Xaa-Pro aminopeptidase